MRNVKVGDEQRVGFGRGFALAAILGVLGVSMVQACAESDAVTGSGSASSSTGTGTEVGSSSTTATGTGGAGGMGGAGGQGGQGGMAGAGGMGGQGGQPCVPTTETCDGKDNNCDGTVDEGCDCVTGTMQDCYDGPDGTKDVGVCKGGKQTCNAQGKWGACDGEVVPGTETCDGKDNNCDTAVDEGCKCITGAKQACYTGPSGTENQGLCKPGTQTCDANGEWGPCQGDATPQPEQCNGFDDNCDGTIDEGDPGGGSGCVAPGLGECKKGTLHCVNGAVKCAAGAVTPETCDGLDNNCDGNIDEGNPGGGMQCMTGLLGLCATGITKCDGANGVICSATVAPGQLSEACNGLDDNCNGLTDEAIPQVGMACTAPGFLGICQFGTYDCPKSAPFQLTCVHPAPGTVQETCNGKDDDCNGTIDDPALVNGQPCGTGFPGVCATGTTQCVGGSSTCNATVTPGSQSEICDSKDNNCNGQTDEMNPTPACTSQNPNAQFVSSWSCNAGSCKILQCQIGYADINGAQGDGCECATDQYATTCSNAGAVSVPKGGTVNMVGKVETAGGSDWLTFNFIAPAGLGQAYTPKLQLVNNAGGQYAMDVQNDCAAVAACNGAGMPAETGANVTVWELNYQYNPNGNPQGPWSDMDAKISSVKVRVYRKNGTPPTCDQYTVTATNP